MLLALSLFNSPYYLSLTAGLPGYILCPHRAVVGSSCWSANTGMTM